MTLIPFGSLTNNKTNLIPVTRVHCHIRWAARPFSWIEDSEMGEEKEYDDDYY